MKQPYPLRRTILSTNGEVEELVILDKDGNELSKSQEVELGSEIKLQHELFQFVSKPNEPIYVTWESVVEQVKNL